MPKQYTCVDCGAFLSSHGRPRCKTCAFILRKKPRIPCPAPGCGQLPERAEAICCSRACSDRMQRLPTDFIVVGDGTVRLPLHARDGSIRAYATIDAADAERFGQYRWSLSTGYARRCERIDGKSVGSFLHRELLGLTPGDGMEGDHIDRDRLNCVRSNLRALPKLANQQNTPSARGSSSQYRGVSLDKHGKWLASVHVTGKNHRLGRFELESDAAEAARAGRLRLLPYAVD